MRDFFVQLWRERPHYSFVSGEFLGHEPLAHFFSHVLSRGAHPKAALDPDNIVFMTFEEHQLWEFNRHKIRNHPNWQRVFELREMLLDRYKKF